MCDVTIRIQTPIRHKWRCVWPSHRHHVASLSMACFTKIHQGNESNCEVKKYVTKSISNSLDKNHLISVYLWYVCDKRENARLCAKWSWNALDLCFHTAHPASPVVQSSETVSFHCHFVRTHAISSWTLKESTTICLVSSKITTVGDFTALAWCNVSKFRTNFVRNLNALGHVLTLWMCFRVFHFCSKIPKCDRVHGVCFRAMIHHH